MRLLPLVCAVLVSGCSVKQARLYELNTAAVLTASYKQGMSGAGPIWLGQKSDRDTSPCRGEYVTVPAGATGWGAIYRGASTTTVTTSTMSTDQRGQAVMNCADGVNYQCEYVTSSATGHGAGACIDNRQRNYRLMF